MYKPKEAKLFGAALKQLLREKNLSDRQFAKRAGLSHSHVSKILNPKPGKEIAEPRKETRKKLAQGLGITEQELLAQMARYSDSEAEKTISSRGLAESEEAIAKPHQASGEAIDASVRELSPEQKVLEQSQPNYPFSGEQENTSQASKQINAFLIQESFFKLASQNSLDWLGAVLSLQGIATRDDCSPDDFWRIMKYLAAFIRTNTPRKKEEEGEKKRFFKRIPDYIQEALTVIVQRDLNPNEGVLDLSNTDLRGARFSKPNLHRVNLRGSNLKRVSLSKANLHGADLRGANLQKTLLWEAELQWAKLCSADLQEAFLHKANLQPTFRRLLIESEVFFSTLESFFLKRRCTNALASLHAKDVSGMFLIMSIITTRC